MRILVMNGANQDFLISCKKRPNQRQYISLLKKLSKFCNCKWRDFRYCYGEIVTDDWHIPTTMADIVELEATFPTKYRADISPPHN